MVIEIKFGFLEFGCSDKTHIAQNPLFGPVSITAFIHHLSTPLRRYFFSLLSYSMTRLCEYIQCCMRCTAILKNDSTAEKRREEEAFALASIAHYCFVETKTNCDVIVIT